MIDLCKLLELDYCPEFLQHFGSIKLSGDSGRSSITEIAARKRRPVPEQVLKEMLSSQSFNELMDRLGYIQEENTKQVN